MQNTITPLIRVSTAGIWYPPSECSPHGRYQVDYLWLIKPIVVHKYIVKNLKEKFNALHYRDKT